MIKLHFYAQRSVHFGLSPFDNGVQVKLLWVGFFITKEIPWGRDSLSLEPSLFSKFAAWHRKVFNNEYKPIDPCPVQELPYRERAWHDRKDKLSEAWKQ